MGVRGLTALIKRHAPQAITNVEGGLQHFRNQTIVLDGNLVIQRLHFGSPFSHPHRSLPALYRLLNSLRAHDVKPIVLFDGPSRPAEKQKERARRREILALQKWRAEQEEERGRRLGELEVLMKKVREMENGQGRTTAVRSLEEALEKDKGKSPEAPTSELSTTLQNIRRSLPRRRPSRDSSKVGSADDTYYDAESFAEPDASRPLPSPILAEEPIISQRLVELYRTSRSFAESSPVDSPRLSKNQKLITSAELYAFQSIASLGTPSSVPTTPEALDMDSAFPSPYDPYDEAAEHLADLSSLSAALAENYRRRSTPPSSDTHVAAQTLLSTMGVPVLLTPEATEAEALAASLVLDGKADVVASEDTDVVVYEADLVRKLGDAGMDEGGEPVLVKGREVRRALELTKEQWVDLALLCGTDYLETLPGIAGVRGLRLIREHGSIENILEGIHSRHHPPSGVQQYLTMLNAARRLFLQPPPVLPNLDLAQRSEGDVDAVWQRLNLSALMRMQSIGSNRVAEGWEGVGRSLGDGPGGSGAFESEVWRG